MRPTDPFRVRLATHGDHAELAQVLGRAFHDDPVMTFVIRKQPRATRAAVLLGLFAHMHRDDESVWVAEDATTGEIVGAAVWALPDHWRVPIHRYLPHAPKLLRAVGLAGAAKISVLTEMERRHPREPHHYLALIGTDPAHQGRGIGTALLEPVLARCDAEGLPAYLESSKASNVPFYRRFRFEVTEEFTLTGGPTMYPMWRPAPN